MDSGRLTCAPSIRAAVPKAAQPALVLGAALSFRGVDPDGSARFVAYDGTTYACSLSTVGELSTLTPAIIELAHSSGHAWQAVRIAGEVADGVLTVTAPEAMTFALSDVLRFLTAERERLQAALEAKQASVSR